MSRASPIVIPAKFHRVQPWVRPAIIPISNKHRVGGSCRPRSQRETAIAEQFSLAASWAWLSLSFVRRFRMVPAQGFDGGCFFFVTRSISAAIILSLLGSSSRAACLRSRDTALSTLSDSIVLLLTPQSYHRR